MLNLACFLSVKLKCLHIGSSGPLYSTACCLSASLEWVRLAWMGGSLKTILCSGVEQPGALQWSPGKALSLPQSLSQNPAEEQLSGDCVYGQRLKGLSPVWHTQQSWWWWRWQGGDDDWSCSVHLCQTLCPRTLQPSIIHLALTIILWEVL